MPAETISLHILVNGQTQRFPTGSNVCDVVDALGLPRDRVAVEFDRKIVKRELWPATTLAEGSQLEIVQFVGGG